MQVTLFREKKGRANVIKLVKKCICPLTVLTKERLLSLQQGLERICTYYHLAQEEDEATSGARDEGPLATAPTIHRDQRQQLLFKGVERLMKKFKTHRCALEFDERFVKAELREEEEEEERRS